MRVLLLLPLLALAGPPALRAESRHYDVDPAESRLQVSVGKSGLFSFAGHEHEVSATGFTGKVTADDTDLARSSVTLEFPASGLKVGGKDEPPEDVPKVQEKMAGAEVLDVPRFPTITFRSTAVNGKPSAKGGYDLELTGELSLHGVTKALTLPVHVEVKDGTLTASGHTTLRQSDWGIKPVSVGGVVKVKNELALEWSVVARSAP